jgi:hypothetical protein
VMEAIQWMVFIRPTIKLNQMNSSNSLMPQVLQSNRTKQLLCNKF